MSGVVTKLPRARNAWVDYAKGIGTLLVVFGHVWRGLHTAALPMNAQVFATIDAFIYSFHMPLFFLLSGLFIERAARKPTPEVLRGKARTVVYPYVVWTLLYGTANVALSRLTNSHLSFTQFVPSFLWAPYAHFWFLYALLGCSLLYVGLAKAGLNSAAIAIAAMLLYATIPLVGLGPWGVPYLVRSYFLYFALGAWFQEMTRGANAMRTSSLLVVAAASMALCGAAAWFGLSDAVWAVPWLAVVGTLGVLAVSRSLENAGRAAWLLRLGELSLPVYVAHTLGTAAARIVLSKGAHVDNLAVHVVVGMAAGLALPLALHTVARRARFRYLFTLPAPEQRAAAPALAKAA